MLHIKDIEAFAHINEALAKDASSPRPDAGEGTHQPPFHPALLMAMMATGRLKPEDVRAKGLSGAMTRTLGPRKKG